MIGDHYSVYLNPRCFCCPASTLICDRVAALEHRERIRAIMTLRRRSPW
jgi:hypothetical protein